MKVTKSQLKQIIKEEMDSSPAVIALLKDILAAVKSVDTSIDYLTAAQTGEDPLTISTLQKTMGRYRLPSKFRGDTSKEDA